MRHRPEHRTQVLNLIFWLPTFAGVAILAAVLIFIMLRLGTAPGSTADLLPTPILPFQQVTPGSLRPPSGIATQNAGETSGAASADGPDGDGAGQSTTEPNGDARPATARPPAARTVRPPVVPRPTVTVTGTYRVMSSYVDGFIGEVLVTNRSTTAVNWTVTLRFPGTVGQLYTSWVESAPQATLSASGQTYTWRSGVPVPVGSSVPLRFQFARSGSGNFPTTCTVNGAPCDLRR